MSQYFIPLRLLTLRQSTPQRPGSYEMLHRRPMTRTLSCGPSSQKLGGWPRNSFCRHPLITDYIPRNSRQPESHQPVGRTSSWMPRTDYMTLFVSLERGASIGALWQATWTMSSTTSSPCKAPLPPSGAAAGLFGIVDGTHSSFPKNESEPPYLVYHCNHTH